MSIRDDHEDVDRIQLATCKYAGHLTDFENVGPTSVEFRSDDRGDLCGNPLVVSSKTLETQGESPKCMYHLLSPTVPAKTPVDPRFSSEKPPRVRMILPELNRGNK
jgi:hypothetical protein